MQKMVDYYECSFCKAKLYCDNYWKGQGDPIKCPECNCKQLIYKYCAIIYLNSRVVNENI
jgi:hypothetical protein